MAAKVTFLNENDKAKCFKANLFGPDKNRVKVANVLAVFKASAAAMGDGSIMEADDDGLSIDTFVAGATYNLSLVRNPKFHIPEGGPRLKRARREAADHWQSFVQSAATHYRQWEEADKAAQGDAAEGEMDCGMSFLKVSGDPFDSFQEGFLIWIRKCYKDLKEILAKSRAGERFIVLGTSGIGKSYFSVFWICYLATMKEKVVWKVNNRFLLLDFSDEASSAENAKVPKVYDLLEPSDPALQEVFRNPAAWLIIDGAQRGGFACGCHVLLPCSPEKKNYHEFSKSQNVTMLYLPVWEEEEIKEFVDAFEHHRADYSQMDVPLKEKAMENFELLGGVPRYVLCSRQTSRRLQDLSRALEGLTKGNCLRFLVDSLEMGIKRDVVVHMTCGQSVDDKHGKYSCFIYNLPSYHVLGRVRERFEMLSKVSVVQFLRENAHSTDTGSTYGYVFEFVAHYLMKGGGEYRMKRVMADGRAEEVGPLKLSTIKVKRFQSWKTFPPFEASTYYWPHQKNLQSVDALLHPNLLLQFFSYSRGYHGYKVQGLLDAHATLKLPQYKVCSCVPKDKYEETGFQPWINSQGTKYIAPLPQVIKDTEQYVIEVDYEKY